MGCVGLLALEGGHWHPLKMGPTAAATFVDNITNLSQKVLVTDWQWLV
jgi:hypothetical protein